MTHNDLPVEDVSGYVNRGHGFTTERKLGTGVEVPGVGDQMTFTVIYFSVMTCKN